MDKIIVTDVDGVLFDWSTHFHNYMQSHGHIRAHEHDDYWQELSYAHLSQEEAKKMVYHFNTSSWMLDVPVHSDARSGVARCVDAGYKFVAITAMGTDPYAQQARQINLDNTFGKGVFIDLTCTDMYDPDSKRTALKHWYAPGRPWVEDKPSNAEIGASLGYRSFLMLHGYNENYVPEHDIESVGSWGQLCDSILDTD